MPTELKSENGHLQAVVEIPAGSTDVLEWDEESKDFIAPKGKEKLNFLPYPGNFGFIPGTHHPKEEKGNDEALDVLVLSSSQPVGTVIEIEPLAMLKLMRKGQFENKVIAVPVDEQENILGVKNYYELQRDHYLCKNMLMEWFLHVYRSDSVIFIGWENEKIARGEIERRRSY